MRVLPVPDAERAAVVATLARAFHDDPGFAWAVPDEVRRRRVIPLAFASLHGALGARIQLTGVEGEWAFAVWGRTDDVDVTTRALLAHGAWRLPLVAGIASLRRLAALGAATDRARRAWAPPGAIYLLQIGVDPAVQRCGLGRLLLEEGLARARAAGNAVYLDTESPRAAALYQRLGFIEQGRLQPAIDSPAVSAFVAPGGHPHRR